MHSGQANEPIFGKASLPQAAVVNTLNALFEDCDSFMCLIVGADHRFAFSNKKNCQLLAVEDVVGKKIADVSPDLLQQGFVDLVSEVYKTGKPFVGHGVPMNLKGVGGPIFLDFIYEPVFTDGGEVAGVVSIGHDVTEHQHALIQADAVNDALQNSAHTLADENSQLRHTLDNLPQMVWLADPDGQPDYFSEYWCEFTGVSHQVFAEGGWVDVFHPDDREETWGRWLSAVRTGEIYQTECRIRHHAGGYRWVLSRSRPELNESHDIVRWYGTCTDINERVVAEQQISHLRSELVHASRLSAMGSMAATVAHEVNQPLLAIASYAAGLRRMIVGGAPASDTIGILAEVEEVTIKAGAIIKRLRDLALGQKPVAVRVEAARLVHESVSLASAGGVQGVEIHSSCPDELFILADEVQIQQVLTNLIRNACQAAAVGQEGAVVVTVVRVNDRILFSVEDNGPGVPHNMISNVFDGFGSTKEDGMGVGLAISRTIVEASGGRIWAQNKPDGGAKFSFALPTSL